MYSRTILLAAASLTVAGMTNAANAAPTLSRSHVVARKDVPASLHFQRYRLFSEPHFASGHFVARGINPSGRVVLMEINPADGALMGEAFI